MDKEIYTIKELAERWDMSVSRLLYWRSINYGPVAFQVGGAHSKLQYHINDIREHEEKRLAEEKARQAEKHAGKEGGVEG